VTRDKSNAYDHHEAEANHIPLETSFYELSVTTTANDFGAEFHDRLPVILSPNLYAWTDKNSSYPGKIATVFVWRAIERV
jgi:putative SOS response-associated peptidase YedK